jgi:Lrp/AsnC family leucine-responsive transcriptional regulator
MPTNPVLKNRAVDEIDMKILMILQDNCRESLKSIAEKVGLSIDSVHKRIKEMLRKDIFWPTISIDARHCGYPLISDNKIRLKNADEKQREEFINYLIKHPLCTDLLGVIGDYDLTCVLIAKDDTHLYEVLNEVKYKYRDMIDSWTTMMTVKTYKFDTHTLS